MARQSKKLHDEPTEADRCEDVERQYREFRSAPDGTIVPVIFCPWCTRGNKPGDPPCCAAFTEAVDAIGKKQLASVERQIREIRLGGQRSMHCPYCDTRIPKPKSDSPLDWYRPNVSPVCCDLLHDAVLAISQRAIVLDGIERKKKIEDGLVSAARN